MNVFTLKIVFFSSPRSVQNLPFDINNRYKLTALFSVFFGSAFAMPFLVVRHQLLKK